MSRHALARREATAPATELLAHPAFLASLALWLLNDHVLKAAFGSWLTGKLSDVAGLSAFPVVLAATAELFLPRAARTHAIDVAAAAVAVAFASVQISDVAAQLFSHGLGLAQWPARALVALLAGRAVPGALPVAHVMDASDLLALPFAIVGPALARLSSAAARG
jgi:hypothetical protein